MIAKVISNHSFEKDTLSTQPNLYWSKFTNHNLILYRKIEPNIIFLLADDMGYNDIGYNNPHVQTPNMNKLAEDGIKLEQNYVQATCTPSRIAFLSGMYPYHVGRQNSKILTRMFHFLS